MAIKSILTNQEDFTGEFPVTSRTSALCVYANLKMNPGYN